MSEGIIGSWAEQEVSAQIKVKSFQEVLADAGLRQALDQKCKLAFNLEYGEEGSAQEFSDKLSEGDGEVVIAFASNGEVVGAGVTMFLQAGDLGDGTAASQELSHLFVDPECQGQGYGELLTRERLHRCVERGGNIWSVLTRGEAQLAMYRKIIEEEVARRGKTVSEWTGDPTTQSYAYAYIEEEAGEDVEVTIIFQGRTPNSDSIYKSATITLSPDELIRLRRFAPKRLGKANAIDDYTLRKQFDNEFSQSVGITEAEFNALMSSVETELSLEPLMALDGGYPQVLSITVED